MQDAAFEDELETLRREVGNLLHRKFDLEYPALLSVVSPAELVQTTSQLRIRLNQLQNANVKLAYQQHTALEECQRLRATAMEHEEARFLAEASLQRLLEQRNNDALYQALYDNQKAALDAQAYEIADLKARLAEYSSATAFNSQAAKICEDSSYTYYLEKQALRSQISDLYRQVSTLRAYSFPAEVDLRQNGIRADQDTEIARLQQENEVLTRQNAEFSDLIATHHLNELIQQASEANTAKAEVYRLAGELSTMQKELAAVKSENLRQRVEDLERTNRALRDKAARLEATLEDVNNANETLLDQNHDFEDRIEELKQNCLNYRESLLQSEKQLVLHMARHDGGAAEQLEQSIIEEKQALIALLYGKSE